MGFENHSIANTGWKALNLYACCLNCHNVIKRQLPDPVGKFLDDSQAEIDFFNELSFAMGEFLESNWCPRHGESFRKKTGIESNNLTEVRR